MRVRRWLKGAALTVFACFAGAGIVYLALSGLTYIRYGDTGQSPNESDALLDKYMPPYEVVERHRISVAAPAGLTYDVAAEIDPDDSTLIRAIFKTRAFFIGDTADTVARPHGIVPLTT